MKILSCTMLALFLIGCGESSWNPFGSKKEDLPTSEEIVKTEDTEELKRVAKEALLQLEVEKKALSEAKKEAELANKKIEEVNLQVQKAELETERVKLEAEKKQAPKSWSDGIKNGVERFASDPFMVTAYMLLTAILCFLYHLMVRAQVGIVAYATLVFAAVPASVIAYAAYTSASLGAIVSVAGVVLSFIYSIAKHHPATGKNKK